MEALFFGLGFATAAIWLAAALIASMEGHLFIVYSLVFLGTVNMALSLWLLSMV